MTGRSTSESSKVKVALSVEYRIWMFALLPTTCGIGTAILWARSLRWPRSVDAEGIAFRSRGKLPWRSIERMSVWREHRDAHVSQIEIHHQGSVRRIPVRALKDGENVAETMLMMFKNAQHLRAAS